MFRLNTAITQAQTLATRFQTVTPSIASQPTLTVTEKCVPVRRSRKRRIAYAAGVDPVRATWF